MESFNASPSRWGEPQTLIPGQAVRITPGGVALPPGVRQFGNIESIITTPMVIVDGVLSTTDHLRFVVRMDGLKERRIYSSHDLRGL